MQQPGWMQTGFTGCIGSSVTSGGTVVADFGNFAAMTVTGRKFNDLDGDGTDDGGTDPGLAGWTIELWHDGDANGILSGGDFAEQTAVTNGSGNYSFLIPGPHNHFLLEVAQPGWTQTTPANHYTLNTISSGATFSGFDFGNFQLATISGQKFNDLDGNGALNGGESGLSGWTIFLDSNNNGALDGGESSTTTSGVGGNYTFTGLLPGSYRVREVQQSGWTQTTSNPSDLAVTSGSNLTGVDFGNFQDFFISGRKFEDFNGDGTDNGGTDIGLAGWTIFLDNNNNGTLDGGEPTSATNGSGNFNFTGLGPGTYRVREVQQSGWVQTTADPADIDASSGLGFTSADFGNFQLGILGGRKFQDIDSDGTDNGGTEPGLTDWTIYLDDNNNGILDVEETSVVTDETGFYTLSNLEPGTYRVREVQQFGWTQTTSDPSDITVTSGTTVTGIDFGNHLDLPGLTIDDVTLTEGNSGTRLFVFTLTLSQPTPASVTVVFATADNTATRADNDYESAAGTATFPPLSTTTTVTVLVNGDTKFELDEDFSLDLSSATNAVIVDAQGIGTILQDGDSSSSLSFVDQDNDVYQVSYTGPAGSGVLVTQDDPDNDGKGPIASLNVIGGTTTSQIVVTVTNTVGDGEVTIASITSANLNSVTALDSDLIMPGINLTGSAATLRFDDILGDVLLGTNPGISTVSIFADQIGNNMLLGTDTPIRTLQANNIQSATILVLDPAPTAISALIVKAGSLNADIAAMGQIRSIQVAGGGASGNWDAGGFGKVYVTGGDFSANLTGNNLSALRVSSGDLVNAHFNIAGTFGSLQVQRKAGIGGSISNSDIAAAAINKILLGGDMANSNILAGTHFGDDSRLGGTGPNSDTFASGRIGSISIAGQAINSIIGAGLNPSDGIYGNGNDVIVGGTLSSISSLAIGSTADLASYFAAGLFGPVKINGATVDPLTDARFFVG